VLPFGISPPLPAAISRSVSLASPASSRLPSAFIGVIIAGRMPSNWILRLAMEVSQQLRRRTGRRIAAANHQRPTGAIPGPASSEKRSNRLIA
jgi:hypothetical protein